MYAGALLFLWASIAGHASTVEVAVGVFASAVVLGKIVVEERFLKASYPGYAEYARTTKALIPFVF
jgi:protein-S-isoprenylcysteine O-methyltransferase Ste14